MKAFTDINIRCYHSILVLFGGHSNDRKIKDPSEVYLKYVSSLKDRLKLDNSMSIHHENIRSLAAQLCKIQNNNLNHIMPELFEIRSSNCNIC